MKSPLLALTIAALALGSAAPIFASVSDISSFVADQGASDIDRRGRGGRSKPRVPGGSGCDDPGDILEHPECAG